MPELSDREREILLLTADGKRPAEIARALNIAVSTVGTHLKNGYARLGLKGQGAAKQLILRQKELLNG